MSDSMNSEYDAVFTKKSFDEIDNSDMKTLMVEKIEILTRLCYRMQGKMERMQDKMEIMEIRSRIMEESQEKMFRTIRQELQFEKDFRDVKMACDDNQIGAHKVIIDQNKLVKTIRQEQQFENDFRDATSACDDNQIRTHKVILKSQDDLLKHSSEEDLMEKEAPVKVDKVSWAERLFKKNENSKKAKVEIQGKAKTEDESRKGWKSAPVEFFISNTNVETSIEDVKEAARKFAKIETLEIEKKTKLGATYGSFRIKVERQDYEKCINGDSWPQGWKIRNFYRSFKAKADIITRNVKTVNKENTVKKDEVPKTDDKAKVVENEDNTQKKEQGRNIEKQVYSKNRKILSLQNQKERIEIIEGLRKLSSGELNEYKKLYKDTDWRYADCDIELKDRHIRELKRKRELINKNRYNREWTVANNHANSYVLERNSYAGKWKRETKNLNMDNF